MFPKLLIVLELAICASAAAAEAPWEVGDRKQLFLDQRFIASNDNVTLHMNQPQKLGLVRDEQGRPLSGHVSRVIDLGDKIHLYTGAEGLSVLESTDGENFRQVAAIPGGVLPTIFLDSHESDPARRYKLFRVQAKVPFDPATDGVFASYSADGVQFSEGRRVLPLYIDNPTVVWWDERIGKYVIYTRAFAYDSENQRRIGRIETDDPLAPWPYRRADDARERVKIDNIDVVLQADDQDDPFSDIYYNAATLYPEADSAYFMFTSPFRHFSPQRQPFIRSRVPGGWEDYGLLEIQLATSRDGIHWQRPSREPYVPTGLADEWDRWLAVMAPGMVRRGSYLYQYYMSSGRTHDSVILRPEYDHAAEQIGGIGRVRQRLDGFVSADVDHHGGWLETPVVTFRGNRLRLNVDTGAMGTAFVELRDADGQPIPGFTLADCEEIGGNFIDQRVHWKGNPDVASLAGRPIRLYFRLKRAKLYAFQFRQE